MLEYITFISLLKEYGIKRYICSKFVFFSLISSIIIVLPALINSSMASFLKLGCPIFATIGSVSLAVVIASMSIVVSMSDRDYLVAADKSGMHKDILFLFWAAALTSGINILFNSLVMLIGSDIILIISNMQCEYINSWKPFIMFSVSVLCAFIFVFSVVSLLNLVGTTLRFGHYRVVYFKNEMENNDRE